MQTDGTLSNGRRAHWRNHYQREVERLTDELRNAQARLRAWRQQRHDAREDTAQQMKIDALRASLNDFRAKLARWSEL